MSPSSAGRRASSMKSPSKPPGMRSARMAPRRRRFFTARRVQQPERPHLSAQAAQHRPARPGRRRAPLCARLTPRGLSPRPRSTRLGLSPSRRIIAASHTASTRLCSAAAGVYARVGRRSRAGSGRGSPEGTRPWRPSRGAYSIRGRARGEEIRPARGAARCPGPRRRPGMGAE